MTTQIENNSKKSNKPTHSVYTKTYIDGNPVNVRIGVAWKHSKGSGFNISLNDMVVFENKPKPEQQS